MKEEFSMRNGAVGTFLLKLRVNPFEWSWEKLTSVTTNGGRNTCCSKTGVVGRICMEFQNIGHDNPMVFHYSMHQESLCCKFFSFMKDIMDTMISTVNYIHHNSLKHCQFQEFLKEIDSGFTNVVYYSTMRWLSRSAVLSRLLNLCKVDVYMTKQESTVPQLSDKKWITSLASMWILQIP